MFIGKVYSVIDMVKWTRFETLWFIFYITLWVSGYHFLELDWLRIPWTPVTLIGTAVAFVVGFQNNAVYDRIWEARKIWGGIVNTSRTFGVFVKDMVSDEYASEDIPKEKLDKEIKILTYRHIAWMTALRYAMRQRKPWETTSMHRTNTEWGIVQPEKKTALEDELKKYLSDDDLRKVMSRDNHQTAILYLQSNHVKRLKDKGMIWEFSFLKIEGLIEELFNLQGKTERIKNFPYPRQFASLNRYFMWLFLILLPIALTPQFIDIGDELIVNYPILGHLFVWFTIPLYLAVAWMFHTLERIGRTGENPFEGTSNDVPISTIARGIEIDLRQNLDEDREGIPDQFPADYGVQF